MYIYLFSVRCIRTYYFQTSTGLDPAEIVFHRHSVKTGILPHYVNDLEYLNVISFLDGDPRARSYDGTILVPSYPRCGMTDHSALKTHSLAFLNQTIVRHRVKFRRANLWSFRWCAASRQNLRRSELASVWKQFSRSIISSILLSCLYLFLIFSFLNF